MAFLKKSRIDGNIYVEGELFSTFISNNIKEDSDIIVDFPRVNDVTKQDTLVKFENTKSKLVETLINENISLYSDEYQTSLNSFSFGNKEVEETFEDITLKTDVYKVKAVNAVLGYYREIAFEDLEAGDLYVKDGDKYYSPKITNPVINGKFFYEDQLITN